MTDETYDWEEMKRRLEEINRHTPQVAQNNEWYYQRPYQQHVCPNCGSCPCCGRGPRYYGLPWEVTC